MARLVLIGEGTHHPDINAIGDLVDRHGDGTPLDTSPGGAYSTFQVLDAPELSVAEIDAITLAACPSVANATLNEDGTITWK